MLFKKLEITDIEIIRPFFEENKIPSCDFSMGGVFLWRDFFKTEYLIVEETLIFRFEYFGGKLAFSSALGKNPKAVYQAVSNIHKNEELFFCIAPTEKAAEIKEFFKEREVKTESQRDWFDYLYLPEDLAEFKGKKFSAKRNHLNKFKKLYENYEIKEITKENLLGVKKFLENFPENDEGELYKAEKIALNELFKNYNKYNFFGIILYVNGEIAAFSIGDKIGETLFVHFEKAKTEYEGSYTLIANEFAKRFGKDVKIINREEDMGIMGLRKSKLSYQPTALLEKTNIYVK